MRFAAVLNQDGGTLRTTDLAGFSQRMRQTLEAAGHSVDLDVVAGKDVVAALDGAASRRGIDIVLAGGGDGTISAAAARLMGKNKALAILPAGTMNLFARGLGIPQTLDAALESFVDGDVTAVDIATANGRPFVHQFSIGMHARMVQRRQNMAFGSRLGKIRASAQAAWATINNPQAMKVTLTVGEAEIVTRTTAIGVTNNLFGEGHLPYADDPAVLAQGQLFREEDVHGFEGGDLALLEPAHDMIERFERPRHLQADEVVADSIDRGWRGIERVRHGRCSFAITRATAS